jgi:beta-glucanase (GH16 family)
MKPTVSFVVVLYLTISPFLNAQTASTGNCLTGNYTFVPQRVYIKENETEVQTNAQKYDFSIDYGSPNAIIDPATGSIQVKLTKPKSGVQGEGARISTIRYLQYAKITASLIAPPQKGVVTAFITMSGVQDEIDFEVLGNDTTTVQTDLFYRGIPEFPKHTGTHYVGNVSVENQYTIDWNRKRIEFSINGKVVRTVNQADSYQVNVTTSNGTRPFGKYWYPETPSQVQFGLWDGGNSPDAGVSAWAGGKTDLSQNIQARFNWLSIQCYNDNDEPVAEWPASGKQDQVTNNPGGKPDANVVTKSSSTRTSGHLFLIILSVLVHFTLF